MPLLNTTRHRALVEPFEPRCLPTYGLGVNALDARSGLMHNEVCALMGKYSPRQRGLAEDRGQAVGGLQALQ
jgi:hypothetical protein